MCCGRALAWNSIGHMTVAWSAYQQLTPAEKARVAVLLKLNPYYSKWLAYLSIFTYASKLLSFRIKYHIISVAVFAAYLSTRLFLC